MGFLNSRSIQFIQYILILAFLLTLAACGSSKSNETTDFASRVDLNSSKALAYCNRTQATTLSYKIMAQYVGGNYDPNWAHLRLYSVPAGFETNVHYIQFWKGWASSDSQITHNTTPISFSIYDLQTQTYLKQGLTALSWDNVKDLIPGASVSTFLSRVMFVLDLQDPNGQYTVFTAAVYGTANNVAQESADALIPAFLANPAEYAFKADGSARESVLRNMHPLRGQSGDYSALATALCQ